MSRVNTRFDYLLQQAPTRDYYSREYETKESRSDNRSVRSSSDFYYNELQYKQKFQLAKTMDQLKDVDRTPVDAGYQLRHVPIQEYQTKFAPYRREPEPTFEEYYEFEHETVPNNTRYG